MNDSWQVKVLYDGEPPLCSREVRFLESRDRGRDRVPFEDIAATGFVPAAYGLTRRSG